jgi:hypothetical protein
VGFPGHREEFAPKLSGKSVMSSPPSPPLPGAWLDRAKSLVNRESLRNNVGPVVVAAAVASGAVLVRTQPAISASERQSLPVSRG